MSSTESKAKSPSHDSRHLHPNLVPFRADGRINEDELRRMVNWLIEKGVSGLYPNGSTGEFIRLSFEERKRVIQIVAEENRGRVPILAGAAETNLDMILDACRTYADLGCAAVSVTGPYYYKVSQESIEHFFRELARQSPIDIVLYNIPQFSNEISVPVVTRLALDCPRIVGIKDSSRDFPRFLNTLHAIKPQRPGLQLPDRLRGDPVPVAADGRGRRDHRHQRRGAGSDHETLPRVPGGQSGGGQAHPVQAARPDQRDALRHEFSRGLPRRHVAARIQPGHDAAVALARGSKATWKTSGARSRAFWRIADSREAASACRRPEPAGKRARARHGSGDGRGRRRAGSDGAAAIRPHSQRSH